MLHSNYPKLITSKASVMDRFLMVQVDIYTSDVSRVLSSSLLWLQTSTLSSEVKSQCAIGCQLIHKTSECLQCIKQGVTEKNVASLDKLIKKLNEMFTP